MIFNWFRPNVGKSPMQVIMRPIFLNYLAPCETPQISIEYLNDNHLLKFQIFVNCQIWSLDWLNGNQH